MPGEVTQQTAFALVAVWWQFVPVPGEDHLLVITDAAARLGSKEWLCRHGDRLPFRCCGSPAAHPRPRGVWVQPTHVPHVHPPLLGVRSPDCGGRADRGRGRGDCRRTRRGVLRTPPHPTAPGSLVDLRGRSGGLTGHAHERTKATTPSSTSGSRSARATCSGGRQTGRERLHIRGSQLAPSDVKLQGAVSFANDLHFHSNLRPAVPGHLDDAGAVEGPASREPSV